MRNRKLELVDNPMDEPIPVAKMIAGLEQLAADITAHVSVNMRTTHVDIRLNPRGGILASFDVGSHDDAHTAQLEMIRLPGYNVLHVETTPSKGSNAFRKTVTATIGG